MPQPARAVRKRLGMVVIASYGLNPGQMTLETLTALRRCNIILTNAASQGTAGWLKEYGLDVRIEPSSGVLAKVLGEARRGATVGYLNYGEPLLCNGKASTLIAACRREKIAVQTWPGVSSLSIMLGRLPVANLKPAGVYICSAQRAKKLSPDVDALVYWIGSSPPGELKKLARIIRQRYPADHEVELVSCVCGDTGAALQRIKSRLRDLGKTLKSADDATSLYIPAA